MSGALALIALTTVAQTVEEGVKDLYYGRMTAAKEKFDAVLSSKPTDEEALYWKGIALINNDQLAEAKTHYQNAMAATNQAPLVKVGMGHVLLMEGKNAEAKTLFDQAIETTAHRRNKKYGDPLVLKSIGRAHADGSSKIGDPVYGIEKLNQAAELDEKNPEIWLNIGKLNLKRGPEYGGPAKVAFENAIDRDPNYARSHYSIGKIFESQRNSAQFLDWYNKAIDADKSFAPAYYALYTYYQNRDVNKAKDYLDQYVANAPKDKELDYLQADYLFRSGNYQQSLDKGKAIEAGLNGEPFPKIYKLYALNYDRLGDSVAALNNYERFIKESNPEKITVDDYTGMAQAYIKVPGNEQKAEAMVEKAVELDTALDSRLEVMNTMAEAYASSGNYAGQYKWLMRRNEIKPDLTSRNFFFTCDAAYKANLFAESRSCSEQYIKEHPEEPQGYYMNWRAAVAMDPDTSQGIAIPAIDTYNDFLRKDLDKNKNRIIYNLGYKVYYYLIKSKEYDLALKAADDILAIDPENGYGQAAKSEAERLLKATGQLPAKTSSTTEVGG